MNNRYVLPGGFARLSSEYISMNFISAVLRPSCPPCRYCCANGVTVSTAGDWQMFYFLTGMDSVFFHVKICLGNIRKPWHRNKQNIAQRWSGCIVWTRVVKGLILFLRLYQRNNYYFELIGCFDVFCYSLFFFSL